MDRTDQRPLRAGAVRFPADRFRVRVVSPPQMWSLDVPTHHCYSVDADTSQSTLEVLGATELVLVKPDLLVGLDTSKVRVALDSTSPSVVVPGSNDFTRFLAVHCQGVPLGIHQSQ